MFQKVNNFKHAILQVEMFKVISNIFMGIS